MLDLLYQGLPPALAFPPYHPAEVLVYSFPLNLNNVNKSRVSVLCITTNIWHIVVTFHTVKKGMGLWKHAAAWARRRDCIGQRTTRISNTT